MLFCRGTLSQESVACSRTYSCSGRVARREPARGIVAAPRAGQAIGDLGPSVAATDGHATVGTGAELVAAGAGLRWIDASIGLARGVPATSKRLGTLFSPDV